MDPIPIKDLVHVSLFGNVQCSTQLLHNLMHAGVTVSFMSSHGKMVGIASPLTTKNIDLRKQQFLKFQHPELSLRLTRQVIAAKISNQRTLLRRNGKPSPAVLREMLRLRDQVMESVSLDSIRGLEGRAARLYYEAFPGMLKVRGEEYADIMNGRNRRPPKDPVNAMLSLGYSLLLRDFVSACASVGLDPGFGFFHRSEPGRPALALDLMEPFRPLIVDSVVIRMLNTGEIEAGDFYRGEDSCQLNKKGRFAWFAGYERRMNEELKHPMFSYRIPYRRIIELEVRLLARFLEGELPEYHPLVTR